MYTLVLRWLSVGLVLTLTVPPAGAMQPDTATDEVAETREVHSISGEYDILAKFVVEEDADIGRFVCERVQTLPSIVSTFTIVSLNPFSDDHFIAGRS